jgi:hypothetical protein
MYPLVARFLGATASAFRAGFMPTFPQARYWRLLCYENAQGNRNGNPYFTVDDLELRATVGGADQTGSGTAISSSNELGFTAGAAFDGANGVIWAAAAGPVGLYRSHWIGYDFGSGGTSTEVRELLFAKRPTTAGQQESVAVGLVDYSTDGTTWSRAWAFATPPTWGSGAESRVFAQPTTAQKRFWRILVTDVQGGSGNPVALSRVQFRGTAGGADLATGGVPFSSVELLGYPAKDAFDGTDGTFFHSDTNLPTESWIGYGWTTDQTINEVAIQMRSDAFGGRANQAPTAGKVQSSDDFDTWTDEWSFTSPATWSGTETRVFTRP